MRTNFELGSIPRCVFVSWPLNVTELGFVCCIVTVDVQRQLD
jgi:hypothetical protein